MLTARFRLRLKAAGLLLAIAACLVILLLLPWSTRQNQAGQTEMDVWTGVGILTLAPAIVFFLLMIPRVFSPKPKAADIRTRITGLHKTLESVVQTVNSESLAIEKTLHQLALELDTVQSELATQKKELDHYKELASLTKEQQAAVTKQLSRNRPKDIVLGLIIGIAGSLIAAVVWSLLHR